MRKHLNEFKKAVLEASERLKTSVTNATELLSHNARVLKFNPSCDTNEIPNDLLMFKNVWTRYRDTNIYCLIIDQPINTNSVEEYTRAIIEGSGYISKHSHLQKEIIHVISGVVINPLINEKYNTGDKIIFESNVEHELIFDNASCLVRWLPPLEGLELD